MEATPNPVRAEIAGRHVHLGKLEKKHDSRNLQFANYVRTKRDELLQKPPSSVRRTPVVRSWGMYRNDELRDCTCATVGNIERLLSAVLKKPETPTDADVLEMFDATGPRGEGRFCLDILNRWFSVGFGRTAHEKILAFAEIDPRNSDHMRLAMSLFGNVYCGLALPTTAQEQTVWRIVRGGGADAEPGSWGGHAVPAFDYSTRGITVVTWGQPLRMTWGFARAYLDEAYVVFSPDWLDANRKSATGLDVDTLLEDVEALRK